MTNERNSHSTDNATATAKEAVAALGQNLGVTIATRDASSGRQQRLSSA